MTPYFLLQSLHATWFVPLTIVLINIGLLNLAFAALNVSIIGTNLMVRSLARNTKELTHDVVRSRSKRKPSGKCR